MENKFEKAKQIIASLINEKKISGEEALILMETLFCSTNEYSDEDEAIWESAPLNEEEKKAEGPEKIPQTFEEWQKYPHGYTVIEDRGVYVDPITGESYPQHTYKYIQNPYRPIHTYLNGKRLTKNSVD